MLSCMPAYNIPKKKAQLKVEQLTAGSREYQQLHRQFYDSIFSVKVTSKSYFLTDVHEVYSPELEARYNRHRKAWKDRGYADELTADTLGFVNIDEYSIPKVADILKTGIQVGNYGESVLCDPALGVQLSKHVDVTSEQILREAERTVLVFKFMKGKVKTVDEQMEHLVEIKREPQLGFDTLSSQLAAGQAESLFLSKMYYIYHFENEADDTPTKVPAQICPVAFINFRHTLNPQMTLSGSASFSMIALLKYLTTGALPLLKDPPALKPLPKLSTERRFAKTYSHDRSHKSSRYSRVVTSLGTGHLQEAGKTVPESAQTTTEEEPYIPTDDVRHRPTFVKLDKESGKWKDLSEAFTADVTRDSQFFTIVEVYYIMASKLMERYLVTKECWRDVGYAPFQLEDMRGYLDVTNFSVKQLGEICSNGLSVGTHRDSLLADPNLGVQLSQCPDVLSSYCEMAYEKVILVFRYMTGRQLEMFETYSTADLPAPNAAYDSMVLRSRKPIHSSYLSKLTYLHSYEDSSRTADVPPHVYPVAFLRVKFRKGLKHKIAPVAGPNIELLKQCMKTIPARTQRPTKSKYEDSVSGTDKQRLVSAVRATAMAGDTLGAKPIDHRSEVSPLSQPTLDIYTPSSLKSSLKSMRSKFSSSILKVGATAAATTAATAAAAAAAAADAAMSAAIASELPLLHSSSTSSGPAQHNEPQQDGKSKLSTLDLRNFRSVLQRAVASKAGKNVANSGGGSGGGTDSPPAGDSALSNPLDPASADNKPDTQAVTSGEADIVADGGAAAHSDTHADARAESDASMSCSGSFSHDTVLMLTTDEDATAGSTSEGSSDCDEIGPTPPLRYSRRLVVHSSDSFTESDAEQPPVRLDYRRCSARIIDSDESEVDEVYQKKRQRKAIQRRTAAATNTAIYISDSATLVIHSEENAEVEETEPICSVTERAEEASSSAKEQALAPQLPPYRHPLLPDCTSMLHYPQYPYRRTSKFGDVVSPPLQLGLISFEGNVWFGDASSTTADYVANRTLAESLNEPTQTNTVEAFIATDTNTHEKSKATHRVARTLVNEKKDPHHSSDGLVKETKNPSHKYSAVERTVIADLSDAQPHEGVHKDVLSGIRHTNDGSKTTGLNTERRKSREHVHEQEQGLSSLTVTPKPGSKSHEPISPTPKDIVPVPSTDDTSNALSKRKSGSHSVTTKDAKRPAARTLYEEVDIFAPIRDQHMTPAVKRKRKQSGCKPGTGAPNISTGTSNAGSTGGKAVRFNLERNTIHSWETEPEDKSSLRKRAGQENVAKEALPMKRRTLFPIDSEPISDPGFQPNAELSVAASSIIDCEKLKPVVDVSKGYIRLPELPLFHPKPKNNLLPGTIPKEPDQAGYVPAERSVGGSNHGPDDQSARCAVPMPAALLKPPTAAEIVPDPNVAAVIPGVNTPYSPSPPHTPTKPEADSDFVDVDELLEASEAAKKANLKKPFFKVFNQQPSAGVHVSSLTGELCKLLGNIQNMAQVGSSESPLLPQSQIESFPYTDAVRVDTANINAASGQVQRTEPATSPPAKSTNKEDSVDSSESDDDCSRLVAESALRRESGNEATRGRIASQSGKTVLSESIIGKQSTAIKSNVALKSFISSLPRATVVSSGNHPSASGDFGSNSLVSQACGSITLFSGLSVDSTFTNQPEQNADPNDIIPQNPSFSFPKSSESPVRKGTRKPRQTESPKLITQHVMSTNETPPLKAGHNSTNIWADKSNALSELDSSSDSLKLEIDTSSPTQAMASSPSSDIDMDISAEVVSAVSAVATSAPALDAVIPRKEIPVTGPNPLARSAASIKTNFDKLNETVNNINFSSLPRCLVNTTKTHLLAKSESAKPCHTNPADKTGSSAKNPMKSDPCTTDDKAAFDSQTKLRKSNTSRERPHPDTKGKDEPMVTDESASVSSRSLLRPPSDGTTNRITDKKFKDSHRYIKRSDVVAAATGIPVPKKLPADRRLDRAADDNSPSNTVKALNTIVSKLTLPQSLVMDAKSHSCSSGSTPACIQGNSTDAEDVSSVNENMSSDIESGKVSKYDRMRLKKSADVSKTCASVTDQTTKQSKHPSAVNDTFIDLFNLKGRKLPKSLVFGDKRLSENRSKTNSMTTTDEASTQLQAASNKRSASPNFDSTKKLKVSMGSGKVREDKMAASGSKARRISNKVEVGEQTSPSNEARTTIKLPLDRFLDNDEEYSRVSSLTSPIFPNSQVYTYTSANDLYVTFENECKSLSTKSTSMFWETCPTKASECTCVTESLAKELRSVDDKRVPGFDDQDEIDTMRLAIAYSHSDTSTEHIVNLCPCHALYKHIRHELVDKMNGLLSGNMIRP